MEEPEIMASPDREIDLYGALSDLWRRKWLIVVISLISTLIGVAYLAVTKPIYETHAHVRPPTLSDLSQINETGVFEISADSAFQRALYQLESLDTRLKVFEKKQEGFLTNWSLTEKKPLQIFIEYFSEAIKISPPQTYRNTVSTRDYAIISFRHWNPNYTTDVVNLVIAEANEDAAAVVIEEFKLSLSNRMSLLRAQIAQATQLQELINHDTIIKLKEVNEIKRLDLIDEILSLRNRATALRQDKIVRLKEALSIAKVLGIEEPTSLNQLGLQGNAPDGTIDINTEITQTAPPLYLRGIRILSAELSVLESRDSDDHDDTGIRELEQKLAQLTTNRQVEMLRARRDNGAYVSNIGELRIELAKLEGFAALKLDKVNLMRLDQPAITPSRPVKPRKRLVLALSLMTGGFLGIVIALILGSLQRHKDMTIPQQC
jgi:LPS O-antigen subunit length determinant protein (WzzB/FepE family)